LTILIEQRRTTTEIGKGEVGEERLFDRRLVDLWTKGIGDFQGVILTRTEEKKGGIKRHEKRENRDRKEEKIRGGEGGKKTGREETHFPPNRVRT